MKEQVKKPCACGCGILTINTYVHGHNGKKDLAQCFEEKIERIPECGCWIWMGATAKNGYGNINVKNEKIRRPVRAHRIAWELYNGPIPNGLHVCHHCDTRCCVNPHHLFLGTRSDNMKDAFKKNRGKIPKFQGSNHPQSKLNESQIQDIRNDKRKQRDIAKSYHVSQTVIWNIKNNNIWRHV